MSIIDTNKLKKKMEEIVTVAAGVIVADVALPALKSLTKEVEKKVKEMKKEEK